MHGFLEKLPAVKEYKISSPGLRERERERERKNKKNSMCKFYAINKQSFIEHLICTGYSMRWATNHLVYGAKN